MTLGGCPYPKQGVYTLDRQRAETAMRLLVEASDAVEEAIEQMRGELDNSAFERFVRVAAEVVAGIGLDLMKPIIAAHPDLDPDQSERRVG